MRINNYSVIVPEGLERESGYVGMEHGRQYTLRLVNHDYYRRCDAEVTIDGKSVGGYRIAASGRLDLERSFADSGRFTFYAVGSAEGEAAGAGGVPVEHRGLIQVRFVPERHPVPASYSPGRYEKTAAGVTGLSGHSDQRFIEVADLDRDEGAAVTISLRLVKADPGPRPLVGVSRGNAVPPPVR